jgi:uncharacterized membrane protein YbhN (UPF0104 family)
MWPFINNCVVKIIFVLAALQTFGWALDINDELQAIISKDPVWFIIAIAGFCIVNYIYVDSRREQSKRRYIGKRKKLPQRRAVRKKKKK